MQLYNNSAPKVDKKKASQMPVPSGYRILIAMPEVKDKTDGGVMLADSMRYQEQVASVIGFVVALGPEAYADKAKFPNGPWCKEGDWVVCRTYSGTRVKIHGQEFRFVNDDTIDGVIDDPRGIERA